MPRQLRYFAQPYFRGRLSPAMRYEFSCAVDAEEGGRILSQTADGVMVYQQDIDEEAQIYGDPETLQVLGAVPDWMHDAA